MERGKAKSLNFSSCKSLQPLPNHAYWQSDDVAIVAVDARDAAMFKDLFEDDWRLRPIPSKGGKGEAAQSGLLADEVAKLQFSPIPFL